MSESVYRWNVVRMSIMWASVAFTTYLLHFQLKYLQGNIFTNNNYCAISDFIAVAVGGVIYHQKGLKWTYYFSFGLGLIGGIGILYLETIHSWEMASKDTLTREFLAAESANFHTRMPAAIFLSKFGIAIAFLTSYFASFNDNRIFPIERRATAIGICNLIGRGLTGLAPMINELNEPIPCCFYVAILCVALINASTIKLDDQIEGKTKIIKSERKLK